MGEKIIEEGEKYDIVNAPADLAMRFRKLTTTVGVEAGEQKGGEIFGEASVVELGNEKISIEISPTDFEVSLDEYNAPEKKDFKDRPYEEAVFEKAYGLEENIPQERQNIVRRYFKNLAES